MRIVLAQVNPTVGDLDGNVDLCVDAIERAREAGAHLVLLPELVITGYPPEDLLGKAHFVDAGREALDRVAAATTGITALVGFVDRKGRALYNAAALCRGGSVSSVYRKRRLPNYGVFDEERWFEPGREPEVVDIAGASVGLTVCEDVWVAEPAAEIAALGAKLLVNISASPFHDGKGADREGMLARRARDNKMWVAYCNLVGGQDELIFDGRSVVISPSGSVVGRALPFEEDLLIVDIPLGEECRSASVGTGVSPRLEYEEEVYTALKLGVRDYMRKNGFTDAVIGLSGGIDSALTAALAADALGPEHVHGVLMPSRYSSEGSVADAERLASNLGIPTLELPIERTFEGLIETLADEFGGRPEDVTEQNLQARSRGTLLMALSNEFGWIVLATGNKSELSVGYSTLYGDMVGGFAPIKDIFKTRVYQLAMWRNRRGPAIPEETLSKPPSAELKPGQVDQDTLPPYDELDAILKLYVEADASVSRIVAAGHEEETVERVARMVDAAEYKRRQGPMGIKITPKAFGKDRRMPVTNRYRG
jgi:NAD+ synthase (glutamine-hydrolysing)